jgi:hypothetical protein
VQIEYDAALLRDIFEWQLYSSDELTTLAEELGLSTLLCCAEFDQHQPASAVRPRMQCVFERV